MSDRGEDDAEPVGIEADAPEADWIEQHQPVIDESDDESSRREAADGDEARVSIEADAPEADWIEQHQSVIDQSDEELFPRAIPEEVAEADGDLVVEDELSRPEPPRFAGATSRDAPDRLPSSAGAGPRGCNLIAVVVHALLRGAREAARQIARRNTRSSG